MKVYVLEFGAYVSDRGVHGVFASPEAAMSRARSGLIFKRCEEPGEPPQWDNSGDDMDYAIITEYEVITT